MHVVGLDVIAKRSPERVLSRIDNADLGRGKLEAFGGDRAEATDHVMNGFGHGVLPFEIDPGGKVHNGIGQFLHFEIVQRG